MTPKLPDVPHRRAVRALERLGFKVIREGKHIVMVKGERFVTIPRHDRVDSLTMAGIVKAAGATIDEFKKLL
jgi:predicted RNA binding protein YcfA (HicA-like mRNA interferase family)